MKATMSRKESRANQQALAAKALKSARLRPGDSTVDGLRKLDRAMSKTFGPKFDLKLRPTGIAMAQLPKTAAGIDWTATGTVRCTFSPWRCGPDVDG
jgi:hypothetical protein